MMIAPIKPLVSSSILIYLWAEFLSLHIFRSSISLAFWPARGLSNSLERSFGALTVPVIENIIIDSSSGVWIYCWSKKSNLSDVLCLTYCVQWECLFIAFLYLLSTPWKKHLYDVLRDVITFSILCRWRINKTHSAFVRLLWKQHGKFHVRRPKV